MHVAKHGVSIIEVDMIFVTYFVCKEVIEYQSQGLCFNCCILHVKQRYLTCPLCPQCQHTMSLQEEWDQQVVSTTLDVPRLIFSPRHMSLNNNHLSWDVLACIIGYAIQFQRHTMSNSENLKETCLRFVIILPLESKCKQKQFASIKNKFPLEHKRHAQN